MEKEKTNLQVLTNGIIKENPTLVLVLGTCPTIAITTMAMNAIGMGCAATFVLVGSNVVISALRKVIPDKVRIPCFIVIIAGFVTLLSSLLQAFFPSIYDALGLFLPLIVVNCIILGRAEMFASKNTVVKSALDGVGMGIGFTLALLVIGSIREILGSGTWFGIPITANFIDPISIFVLAPGGFLVFGCVIALLNKLTNGKAVKRKSFDCASCPNAAGCANAGKGECE